LNIPTAIRGAAMAAALLCAACSARKVELPPPPLEKITAARTYVPRSGELPGLIGRMQQHRIEEKETLLDVARDAGLGFNGVRDANPGVDEWIPPAGLTVAVPTQWVVPPSRYRGLVVNIPEMRLYMFPQKADPGHIVTVRTWAIGIGTDETP